MIANMSLIGMYNSCEYLPYMHAGKLIHKTYVFIKVKKGIYSQYFEEEFLELEINDKYL